MDFKQGTCTGLLLCYILSNTSLISFCGFWTDTIFGTSAKNADIYEQHAKAVVLSAVAGFNGNPFVAPFLA